MNTVVYKNSNGNILDILPADTELNGVHKDYAVAKLEVAEDATSVNSKITDIKEQLCGRLAGDAVEYVFSKFDMATLTWVNNRLIVGTSAQKTKAKKISDWIISVIQYHKDKEAEINAATTVGNSHRVAYDLSQFDATCPELRMVDII